MTPPPANKKKEIGIPDRHDDRNSTLGRGLRGQQAGELKRQTQSVDAQEGRFRIFTGVRGRGQPVEKVVVGPVGGPKEARNQSKTLQRRRFQRLNRGQNRARRSFSTGWGILRSSR